MAREFSHAPSDLAGACEPCASGDHGGCNGHPDAECHCYAADWEGHERLFLDIDRPDPLTHTIRVVDTEEDTDG